MNFKNAYKSYNDEIKGNPEVLDAILNKKEKKKPVFFIRPAFVCAVAAMLVLAGSVITFDNIGTSPSDESAPKKTYIAANGNKTGGDIIADKPAKTVIKPDDKKTEPEKEKQPAKTEFLQNNPQPAETTDETVIPAYDADTEPGTDMAREPAMPMTSGLFHRERAYSPEDEFVSAQDFFACIGVNVLEKAKLPDDMAFSDDYAVNALTNEETGEVISGSFTASAHSVNDNQRYLSLSVSKSDGQSESFNLFNVESSGEITGAMCVTQKLAIVVDSQNVTEAELQNLINSLQ